MCPLDTLCSHSPAVPCRLSPESAQSEGCRPLRSDLRQTHTVSFILTFFISLHIFQINSSCAHPDWREPQLWGKHIHMRQDSCDSYCYKIPAYARYAPWLASPALGTVYLLNTCRHLIRCLCLSELAQIGFQTGAWGTPEGARGSEKCMYASIFKAVKVTLCLKYCFT